MRSRFQKRKREEEGGDDRKKEEEKIESYKVKYIGESNRSGYERDKEYMDQFKNMDERSHLLKHYLQHHKNMYIHVMEVGIKVRSTFKNAIERQISEAVAISKEEREGTNLMNSKATTTRWFCTRGLMSLE